MKRDLSEKKTERTNLSYFDTGWKVDKQQ